MFKGSKKEPYIFISYRASQDSDDENYNDASTDGQTKVPDDNDVAINLKHRLNDAGISCWMAPESITAGEIYSNVINEALKNCAAVVVVLSKRSVGRKWTNYEIRTALKYKKKIIPYVIDEDSFDVIRNLKIYKKINAAADKDKAFKNLIKKIRKEQNLDKVKRLKRIFTSSKSKKPVHQKKLKSKTKRVVTVFAALSLALLIAIPSSIYIYNNFKDGKSNVVVFEDGHEIPNNQEDVTLELNSVSDGLFYNLKKMESIKSLNLYIQSTDYEPVSKNIKFKDKINIDSVNITGNATLNDIYKILSKVNCNQVNLLCNIVGNNTYYEPHICNAKVLFISSYDTGLGEDIFVNGFDFLKLMSLFSNIESLNISGYGIETPDYFPESLSKLKELSIFNNDISSINFLKNSSNLETLNLLNVKISDFAPLANVRNSLRNFSFVNDNFEREAINIPNSMSALESVFFKNIHIENTDFLSGYSNLSSLSLVNCDLKSISSLKNLDNIKDLYIYEYEDYNDCNKNAIKDLSVIDKLEKKIETLCISGLNELDESTIPDNMINLSKVIIYNCSLDNADFLKNSSKLTTVQLSYNNISSLDFLKDKSKIKSLNISNNPMLSDITPIKNSIGALKEFEAEGCNLSDISVLSKANLEMCIIGNNEIESLKPLRNSTDLIVVSANKNKIKNTDGIENKDNLQYVNLASNEISKIGVNGKLKIKGDMEDLKYTYLNLSDNNIENIAASNIELKENFTELYLYKNKIIDFSFLNDIKEACYMFLDANMEYNFCDLIAKTKIIVFHSYTNENVEAKIRSYQKIAESKSKYDEFHDWIYELDNHVTLNNLKGNEEKTLNSFYETLTY